MTLILVINSSEAKCFNHFTPKSDSKLRKKKFEKLKIKQKFKISFWKTLKNKFHYLKVLPKSFHFNGHNIKDFVHITKN